MLLHYSGIKPCALKVTFNSKTNQSIAKRESDMTHQYSANTRDSTNRQYSTVQAKTNRNEQHILQIVRIGTHTLFHGAKNE